MNEPPKRRWGCLQWGMVVGTLYLLGWLAIPSGSGPCRMPANQMKAVNNCKQVILSLMQYSKDADTVYPDGRHLEFKSANKVFRELFKEGIVTDERIFGSPKSVFHPDNDLGLPPGRDKTLMPGECHWMLLKHQTDTSHPRTPIVIENSLDASWPPRWSTSRPSFSWWSGDSLETRGRAWRGHYVIIGRNDGSVSLEKLRPDGTLD